MALHKRDKEFRLPKISYLDFKQIEMDRVLTALFARLAHNGYPSRLRRRRELTIDKFVDEVLEKPELFKGFSAHRELFERWVETELMDMVNRGKPNQAIAAPRPLHGRTYLFRNPKHSRDYGAAQHVYEMLAGARQGRGQGALDRLKGFFFAGYDEVTGKPDPAAFHDVETQALLCFVDQVKDVPDQLKGRDSYPPLCVGSADLFADDVMRLLFYRRFIPRSVMVDYLEILMAFHLALYHLRLFKLLPALLARQSRDPICAECPLDPLRVADPHGDCPHRIGLLVDVEGHPDTAMATLAEHSADVHYRRIPTFVRAYFATRKLDEFAVHLRQRGRMPSASSASPSVAAVHELLDSRYDKERDAFFGQRTSALIENASGGKDDALDPELEALVGLELGNFDLYIEMLVALRGGYHRKYITECLDTLLLKNRAGALIAQPRTKHGRRRFVIDSRLLEVLLQLAVLKPGGALHYHTAELRVDEVLLFLRERYGLFIDRLPRGDGFAQPTIDERRALRANAKAFVGRLREVGFFRDLSDAYVTQTVTPRYRIDLNGELP